MRQNNMNDNKIILGVVGKSGSGKSAVQEYFKERHNAATIKFSDSLRDILRRIYIPDTRDNLQKLSTNLRELFGNDLLDKVINEDIKNFKNEIIIIDGIRRPTDFQNFRNFNNFYLIAVETDIKKRYERVKNRGEKADDKEKSWEEFLAEENNEAEIKIDDVMKMANFVIDNNGDLDNLHNQLEIILNKIKKA